VTIFREVHLDVLCNYPLVLSAWRVQPEDSLEYFVVLMQSSRLTLYLAGLYSSNIYRPTINSTGPKVQFLSKCASNSEEDREQIESLLFLRNNFWHYEIFKQRTDLNSSMLPYIQLDLHGFQFQSLHNIVLSLFNS
jgi:hypothetical protein